AHVQHGVAIAQKAEGTCGCDFAEEVTVGKFDLKSLAANQRVWEVDGVADGVTIARIHSDELIAFAQLDRFHNADVRPLTALLAQPGAHDHVDEGLRTAVEN